MAIEPNKVLLPEKEENGDQGRSETKCKIQQTLTALGPIMCTVAAGMTSGYSAILLPQIKQNNSTNPNVTSVNITDYLNMNQLTISGTEEESWIAASAALAMIPGCWIAGLMMEKFGRRGSFLILSPVSLTGWLLVGLAPDIFWMVIGRFICGLCTGVNGPLSPVYIAETSEPSLRGIFLAGISLAIAIGVVISHILGTWLHWRLSGVLCGISSIMCFIFCLISPESPTWLVKKSRFTEARKVWIRLRGEQCEREFEGLQSKGGTKMRDIVKDENDPEKPLAQKSLRDHIDEGSSSPSDWKITISSRGFLMPLLILIVFFFASQFSGSNAVVFYSVDLFENIVSRDNAYLATLLLDVVRVVFSVVACWMTRNYRRRTLTIVSGIGTVISLLFLSGSLVIDKPWLSISFLFLYMCVVSIGLVPLPWLLCGELFSTSVRGLGSGLTSSCGFIFFFIVVKTSPGLNESLGQSWTFAFYGIIVLAGTIFLYFFLPETMGKTLNEIEERFANPKAKTIAKMKASAAVNNR